MKRYKKKPIPLVAIRIPTNSSGFTYERWGATQTAKPGDWLVDREGSVYSIDHESFLATYEAGNIVGHYYKHGFVWARVATVKGEQITKEGSTEYVPGDYIVSNDENGADAYAISKDTFESMYDEA